MAGSPSDDGPATRLEASDANTDMSDFQSTPQPTTTSSSFQAINRISGGQSDSGSQSRDVSARATPQADSAPAQKQAPAASTLKASAQADALDSTGSGSYGTRSRRTGKERLNYAEDQEPDFDFTSAATTAAYTKKSAAAAVASAQGTTDAKRAKDSATTNGAHSSANNQTTAKDSAQGASTASTTNPKKRKAAGTATPTNQTSTPPVSVALAVANMRKQAPSALARETNMMTFERSRACLTKKGELVADDGTKLNVNGKPAHPFFESPGLALRRGRSQRTPHRGLWIDTIVNA